MSARDLAALAAEFNAAMAENPRALRPLRRCPACDQIRPVVTYDLRAHDFRCPDCREPRWDRFTTWEDIDAAEETA